MVCMNYQNVITANARGIEEFTLEGDSALLFEAKVNVGRDFDFIVPGSDEPSLIQINGLRIRRRVMLVPEE